MPEQHSITVSFELFGPAAASAGSTRVRIDLPRGSTVEHAIGSLSREHPGIHASLQSAVIAADGVMVKRDAKLAGGEELTVITLVSGG